MDLVVLNYNDYQTTKTFLDRVSSYKTINHIVVVDNHSSDNSYTNLSELQSDKIDVIQTPENKGYGFGNNYGVMFLSKRYNSKHVIISNPDVQFDELVPAKCESFLLEHDEYAVVAPRMLNADLSDAKTAWNIGRWLNYCSYQLLLLGKIYKFDFVVIDNDQEYINCDCVAGSFFAIDVSKFLSVGMFDERVFLYCEETILGFKNRENGFKTAVLCREFFVHEHSVTINKSIKSDHKRNKLLWNSREIVLKDYYRLNGLCLTIALIISRVALIESSICSCLKK